jgi:hypothetical protein
MPSSYHGFVIRADGLAAGTWSRALEDRAPSLGVSLARDQSVAIERPLVYRAR